MAKGYKFMGGADTLQLEEGGKVYHAGDMVPLTDEQARQLVASGHYFEGIELPSTGAGVSAAIETHAEYPGKK